MIESQVGDSTSGGRRSGKWWKCAGGPGRGLTDPLTLTQRERPDSRKFAHLWQTGGRKAEPTKVKMIAPASQGLYDHRPADADACVIGIVGTCRA